MLLGRDTETCNQVLLWCLFAYNLWTMTYGVLRISWVIDELVRDKTWKGMSGGKKYVDKREIRELLRG